MSDKKVKGVREGLGLPYTRFIPMESLAAASASFEYGAKKYTSRNWENGLPWQQMIDSLKRHVEDFERGMDYDDGPRGSGLPQVSMIMASAMMLTASVMRNIGEDDRVKFAEGTMTSKECALWIEQALKEADDRMFLHGEGDINIAETQAIQTSDYIFDIQEACPHDGVTLTSAIDGIPDGYVKIRCEKCGKEYGT